VTHEVYTLTERKEKVDVERLVAELEELRRSLTMTAKAIDERLEQIIHTLKAEQAADKQAEEEVDVEAGRVGEEHTPAETSPAAEAPSTVRPPPALRPDQLPPLFRGQAAQRAEKKTTTTTTATTTTPPATATAPTAKPTTTQQQEAAAGRGAGQTWKPPLEVDEGFTAAAAELDWKPMPNTPNVEWAFLTDREGGLAEGFREYEELLAKAGRTPIRPQGDEYEYTVGYSGQGKPKFLRRRIRQEGGE